MILVRLIKPACDLLVSRPLDWWVNWVQISLSLFHCGTADLLTDKIEWIESNECESRCWTSTIDTVLFADMDPGLSMHLSLLHSFLNDYIGLDCCCLEQISQPFLFFTSIGSLTVCQTIDCLLHGWLHTSVCFDWFELLFVEFHNKWNIHSLQGGPHDCLHSAYYHRPPPPTQKISLWSTNLPCANNTISTEAVEWLSTERNGWFHFFLYWQISC